MQDLILSLRLKILERDADALLGGLEGMIWDVRRVAGEEARSLVEKKLKKRVLLLVKSIKDLQTQQVPEAWTKYLEIRENLTKINHEALEIIGGLAIRSVNVDKKICWIVERFLVNIPIDDPPGFTVFSARDTNLPTLARLVRVRFPVKNVWALPLSAHQFAKLVIEDDPKLKDLVKVEAAKEVACIQPTLRTNDSKGELLLRRAERNAYCRWAQLMADGMAVYFTGPCYAGGAVLLQLSPSAVEPEEDSQAPEYERAFVILEMLRLMEFPQDKRGGPYKDFAKWLEDKWKNILAAEKNHDLPSPSRREELRKFVKTLLNLLNQNQSLAKYPAEMVKFGEKYGSWRTAQRWAADWSASLRRQTELTVPNDVDSDTNVRDAFNAGWLCWSNLDSEQPESIDLLANAVLALGERVMFMVGAEQRTARSRGDFSDITGRKPQAKRRSV